MKRKTVPDNKIKSKCRTAFKITGLCVYFLLLAIILLCTVNSLLSLFVDHYYLTFGDYRIFAVTSGSVESEISQGDVIVGRIPEKEDEIVVGSLITYELKQGKDIGIKTGRVTAVENNGGEVSYSTLSGNVQISENDNPSFDDVVGIYTNKKCGGIGYFLGFLQKTEGAVSMITVLFALILAGVLVHYHNQIKIWQKFAFAVVKDGANTNNAEVIQNSAVKIQNSEPVFNCVKSDTAQPAVKAEEPAKAVKLNETNCSEDDSNQLITVGQLLGADEDESDDDEIQLEFYFDKADNKNSEQAIDDLIFGVGHKG